MAKQTQRRTIILAYGKIRGAASRTTPTALGQKYGIYESNAHQRNSSSPILRPDVDYTTTVCRRRLFPKPDGGNLQHGNVEIVKMAHLGQDLRSR